MASIIVPKVTVPVKKSISSILGGALPSSLTRLAPMLALSAMAFAFAGCGSGKKVEGKDTSPKSCVPTVTNVIPENYVKLECVSPMERLYVEYHARTKYFDAALSCARRQPLYIKHDAFQTILKELPADYAKLECSEPLEAAYAASQTRKNNIDEALKCARGLKDHDAQQNAFYAILKEIPNKPENVAQLVAIYKELINKNTGLDEKLLSLLVSMNFKNETLLDIFNAYKDPSYRVQAILRYISQSRMEKSSETRQALLTEAKKIALSLPNDYYILSHIIEYHAENGELAEAMKLVPSRKFGEGRLESYLKIAEIANQKQLGREPVDRAIDKAAAELSSRDIEPENKVRHMLEIVYTMQRTQSSRQQILKALHKARDLALKLKNSPDRDERDENLNEVINIMVKSGFYQEAFADILSLGPKVRDEGFKKIIEAMLNKGLYKECYQMGTRLPRHKLGGFYHYFANDMRLGTKDPDVRKKIDLLVKVMDRQVEMVNPWLVQQKKMRVNYFRPIYEAASQLGHLAWDARKEGNAALVDYIRKNALPKITAMLGYRNPRPYFDKGDYGYVYIIFPMKLSLYYAIAQIGDPSAIPALRNCPDLCARDNKGEIKPYHSDHDNNAYHVGFAAGIVKEYLNEQAKTGAKLIEPPKIMKFGWIKGPFGTNESPFGY